MAVATATLTLAPLPAAATTSRPNLQGVLNGLVTGPGRVAPGATAYVLTPQGTWAGAAGIANVKTGQAMWPDARMRVQSNSKAWLMAVIFQLAEEGKLALSDTVAHWLPGLLPYGSQVTIDELMSDTSGLIDDNDMEKSRAAWEHALANVKDLKLRAEIEAIGARVAKDPGTYMDPMWLVRLAAWQPLVRAPGSGYHHSNIGWNIAGLIAARVAGEPLPALYRQRIFIPLRLHHTSFQPQGPILGPHAEGYSISPNGILTDTTAWTWGKGADGAIVTDAQDEATFLRALLDDQLHVRQDFLLFYGRSGTNSPGCPGNAFLGEGAGAASRSYVYYDQTGTHIAVLLLNGFREGTGVSDAKAQAGALALYCNVDSLKGDKS
ncbi:MAG TPA: serine hydrolase domain-containing protein [Acidimicrobiales bacterium]|nr:serine hydrolase domain-containing protein [Acidimicrobiales bacterium]